MDQIAQRLVDAIDADLALDSPINIAVSIARMLLEHGLVKAEYAPLAERFCQRGLALCAAGQFHQARFHIAAANQFFVSSKNIERSADMHVLAARTYTDEVAARGIGSPISHLLASNLYREAIKELETVPKRLRAGRNVNEELTRLYQRLREAGTRIHDEFPTFEGGAVTITAEDMEAAYAAVADRDLVDGLLALAEISPYASRAATEHEARKALRGEFFSRLFRTEKFSRDGRPVHQTLAFDHFDSDTDAAKAAILERMVQHHQYWIQVTTAMLIVPAWRQLLRDHVVSLDDLLNICLQSRMVPRSRVSLVARGLKAGFDGDFATALHLLVPQLEHFVRTHLQARGVKTVTKELGSDVVMEAGLSALVVKPEMDDVFGPNLTFEIRALFCEQSGPNLRNDLAHGLLEPGATESAESIYAWWLVFRMVFIHYWPPSAESKDQDKAE